MEKKNIIITVIVVALVIVGFVFAYKASNKPSQYQPSAQGMKDAVLKFYGAFWCPNCQAQEKALGMSRQSLERMGLYLECSQPSGQGQLQLCVDQKIESYPTWEYPKEFSYTTEATPTVCEVQPGPAGQSPLCEVGTGYGSNFLKSWIFPGKEVIALHSATDPKHEGNTWTFAAGTRSTGEMPLELLSEFSGVPLPQDHSTETTALEPENNEN